MNYYGNICATVLAIKIFLKAKQNYLEEEILNLVVTV